MNFISKNIIELIQNSLNVKKANLHNPIFNTDEINELAKCIKSTFVSSVGKNIKLFEKKISKITNCENVISIVNGTSALDLSIKVLNIQTNTEIFVPSLTFIAPVNSILYNNCIPHFIDIDKSTLGINPDKLEIYIKKSFKFKNGYLINKKTKRKVSAIIPVHLFGHPLKIDKIIKIAKKYNLKVIEDAAEALGSFYKKKHLGTFGDLGVLSFNGNKIITTGAGGAILTKNKTLAKKIKHLSTTAKLDHPWNYIHDEIGYNYRMSNLNATLGLAQIKKINKILINKRKLFKIYEKNFKNNKYVDLFSEPSSSKSNYWFQTIIIKNEYSAYKEKILEDLNFKKIQSRPAWSLVHKLDKYKKYPKMDLRESVNLHNRIINIPSNTFNFLK